mgnify:CR=1 FL=1
MRKEFSQAIENVALADEKVVFITGDLGYNALENLQQKMGNRFINAGVAEQNMVGMAAGMAYKGFKVFCIIYLFFWLVMAVAMATELWEALTMLLKTWLA